MSSGHIYNPYNSDDETHKYYIITKKQKRESTKRQALEKIKTKLRNWEIL